MAAPFKRKSLTGPEPDEWQSEHNVIEGSGNGHKGRSEVSEHRSMKRIRTSSNTAATKAKATQTKRKGTGKKQRTISLLLTMPLDILFMIFGMLSPRDLINLSRVDASFCHTLTAHNVSPVIWEISLRPLPWKAWKESFCQLEASPTPLRAMLEGKVRPYIRTPSYAAEES
ncbi:hypothetical protein EDD85DRAFT_958363 [Armillaria nabsnona]|nr:hypothetical protein EDD85DRAFT_958363 [Armillaria nabsnona]